MSKPSSELILSPCFSTVDSDQTPIGSQCLFIVCYSSGWPGTYLAQAGIKPWILSLAFNHRSAGITTMELIIYFLF